MSDWVGGFLLGLGILFVCGVIGSAMNRRQAAMDRRFSDLEERIEALEEERRGG